MTTVLVTGFDPFGGEKVNPAYEAVRMLPDRIAGARVITLEIPTAFTRGPAAVERAIERERPDIVISVGQAGGRSAITVEKVAVNLAEARIPDNDGEQPMGVALREDGDAAYFATIPVEAMVMNVRDHGLPAFVSYTAGTYVCNSVMYHMLYLLDRRFPGVRGGFIHVPYAIGQTVDKPNGTPSMSLPDMAKALEYAIEAAVGGGAGDGESGRAVVGRPTERLRPPCESGVGQPSFDDRDGDRRRFFRTDAGVRSLPWDALHGRPCMVCFLPGVRIGRSWKVTAGEYVGGTGAAVRGAYNCRSRLFPWSPHGNRIQR